MYSEPGMFFPYLQGPGFFQETHHHNLHLQEEELLHRIQNSIIINNNSSNSSIQDHPPIISAPSVGNLVPTSTVAEYDMGAEGDLFKAPEPIIEEPVLELDPMTAAISMISSGEDLIPGETLKVAEIESIENNHLLSELFYECKKDLLAKSAIKEVFYECKKDILANSVIEESISGLSDVKISPLQMAESKTSQTDNSIAEGPIQKSVSSGCLTSKDWKKGASTRPNFLGFQEMDFGAAFRMRRAYSEGDIQTCGNFHRMEVIDFEFCWQTLGNGDANLANTSVVRPPFERTLTMDNYKIEERREKLSRYRKKKERRNFGRKIKYACRKALADSQPRVRGRFAKTEEYCDVPKPSKQMPLYVKLFQ